ncbi:MAG: 2-dehydropantoate 2-reductase [Gammaproteobacteria bacterium]
MKVCIAGAGAIGGLLGARLARAGHEVSLLARGPHLAAIRARGLKLLQDGEEITADAVAASDDLGAFAPQDVVLLAVKGHQIAPLAPQLPALLGADGALLTLQNGIPWWYFQRLGGAHAGRALQSVDPGGTLARAIDPARILGCVVYPAALLAAPGVIRHVEGSRFPLGELDGADSARARRISQMLISAGFKAPVLDDIRSEIWLKLWGNLCFNPLSALCHATLESICQFPLSRQLTVEIMCEAQTVAEKLGAHFRASMEKRINGAEKVGKHKTSMLQDAEAGKPLEVDCLLSAVIELAEITETETPALRAVHACISLLNETITRERVAVKAAPLK